MTIYHQNDPNFSISTDKEKLDMVVIYDYLSKEAYWCKNIPLETLQKAIENSLTFGLYYQGKQIGLARIISDFATIAYLGDVFVLDEYRGKGLSKWLMETVNAHPELQGLRRWILLTRDAHELYKKFGWNNIASPNSWMEKHNAHIYQIE